jgi:hypothetical protein
MTSLGQSAGAVGQQFANLRPFAIKARTALIELGASVQKSQPALLASTPLANRLSALGRAGGPTARNLQKLLASLDTTGGIEQLMKVLFNGTSAGNGFNSLGHYVRDEPLVSSCTTFASSELSNCLSRFSSASAAAASAGSGAGSTGAGSAGAGSSTSVRNTGVRASDEIVAQAVESASAGTPQAQPLRGLLGYLTGSGR